jgi:hypothetical protein
VGVSFGGGTGGGVWLLVSTASAALYIHYSVYVLEPPELFVYTMVYTYWLPPKSPKNFHRVNDSTGSK